MPEQVDVQQAVESAVSEAIERWKSELAGAIAQRLPAPAPAPVAAAPETGSGEGGLKDFRQTLWTALKGSGQVELLNGLIESVVHYFDRTVLYLVKGEAFQPWAARGFEGGVGDAAAKAHVVKSSADTILSRALKGTGSGSDDAQLIQGLGAPDGPSAAIPLGIRGKAAAVLYADTPKVAQDEAVAALEMLARLVAAAIELGMLTKRSDPGVRTEAFVTTLAAEGGGAEPASDSGGGGSFDFAAPSLEAEPAAAEPEPTPAPTAAQPEPEPTPAPVAQSSFAPEPPAAPEPAAPPPAPEPAAPEPPAQAPAAEPEGKPASVLDSGPASAGPVVSAGQDMQPAKKYSRWKPVREQLKEGDAADPAMADVPEADRPKHVEAKKIARLLVSEIKLYNEAKVAVGRKNNDLYQRLKEDIDRSRQTYSQRVDPSVDRDYFKQELIDTLAEGDAAALGM